MPTEAAHRLSAYVITLAVIFTAIGAYVGGLQTAWSTGVGGAMAIANWYLLKWIVTREVEGTVTNRGGFLFLLFMKLGAFMFAVYALIAMHVVMPLPFTLGLSALVGGLLMGSFLYVIGSPSMESEH